MSMNEVITSKETLKKRYAYRSSWLHLIRPMTFTGTISPILAGTAAAAFKGPIRFENLIALLISAVAVQSSANILNDYFDFKNGQDLEKWILYDEGHQHHGPRFPMIPSVTGIILIIAAIIGIWLAGNSSYWIILIGIIGITAGFLYSGGPKPLSSVGLGEVTAAIFLGFVPSVLGYMVQGYSIDTHILAVFVPFSLLISSMILTNNIRDLKKDQGFRRTLAMVLGKDKAYRLLIVLIFLPYIWVIGVILLERTSWTPAITLVALPLALKLSRSFRKGAAREVEIKAMKIAAWHHWAFGLLFAAGLWLGSL